MTPQHIYVLEFSPEMVKVGRTRNPNQRVAKHRVNASSFGFSLERQWVSEPHVTAEANEQALIGFATKHGTLASGNEFFHDVDFDALVAYANTLPINRYVPTLKDQQAAEAAAQENAKAQEAKAQAEREARAKAYRDERLSSYVHLVDELEKGTAVVVDKDDWERTRNLAQRVALCLDIQRKLFGRSRPANLDAAFARAAEVLGQEPLLLRDWEQLCVGYIQIHDGMIAFPVLRSKPIPFDRPRVCLTKNK